MSQLSHAPDVLDETRPEQRLGIRARMLLGLEQLFPVLETAPAITGDESAFEYRKAAGSYQRHVDEVGGLDGKTILDFGCGWGGETVWLGERAKAAMGCDINKSALRDANDFARQMGAGNVKFAESGVNGLPYEDETFDAIFSTNVFEHVMQPAAMLSEIRRVLKPGGRFVSQFGPLFYSPLGYHLCWATQVPWAHLLFGFEAVIQVRNTKREPWWPKDWKETGLNKMRFKGFESAVSEAGLGVVRCDRIAVKGLKRLAKLPLIGDLLTFGIDCHLVRED
ncbi:class I SAM-dependent methyltransferase [Poriferisphaera sp. WC338]|uniref:class I SAM-dependent methyltransferase n=1 Tax=Poriferisphaera sp. WC338 TaxID=3425129 RepID=UPI003D8182C6